MLLATGLVMFLAAASNRRGQGATELKLDKDFLTGIVENLPPSPFEKKGQYKGTVHSYRLLAIDPRLRRFLAACQVEGEFRPPVSGPVSEHVSRSDDHTSGLRKFRFEIKAGVYVEAGPDATPRFRVDVEEIKKAELEGIIGLLAKFLGKYFDDMITQIADGRAAILNQKLNAEVAKRAAILKQYGTFCGIDYLPDQVVLHFDVTRFKREGIVGYVFNTAAPERFRFTVGWTSGPAAISTRSVRANRTGPTPLSRVLPVMSSSTRPPALYPCTLGMEELITCTLSPRTGKVSGGEASDPPASLSSFSPNRRRIPCRSTGFSTRETVGTSTRRTRMPSSRSSLPHPVPGLRANGTN